MISFAPTHRTHTFPHGDIRTRMKSVLSVRGGSAGKRIPAPLGPFTSLKGLG
jgi:hypothetical protein